MKRTCNLLGGLLSLAVVGVFLVVLVLFFGAQSGQPVAYYNQNGTSAGQDTKTVGAYGVVNLYHKTDGIIPEGFQGSAVIQSRSVSQLIAVMANPSKDGYQDLAESYNAFNW